MASTGSVMNYDITTPNPFAVPPPAATISAETITDAIKSLETSHNVLKIAGAKPDQLASLRTNITGLRKQMASLQEERVRMAKLDKEVFGPGVDDDTGEMKPPSNTPAGFKLYSGVISKFQRGHGGFSAVWKDRWLSIEKGWLKCYGTSCRPSPGDLATGEAPEEPTVFIPLTDKSTVVETDLSSAFRKKFASKFCFTVSTKDVFGSRRCMTFDCKTDKDKQAWLEAINSGIIVTKYAPQPSIYRAAQLCDLSMLKQLVVSKGKNVNASNRYGMSPLMYAISTAGRAAGEVSKGQVPSVSVQTAFQTVAYIMAEGGNPTAKNDAHEDCFKIAKKVTEDYPRARRLLLHMLDSSTYSVEGGDVWVTPKDEKSLIQFIDRELNGILVEDVQVNKEIQAGRESSPSVSRTSMLYSQKKVLGSPVGKGGANGSVTNRQYNNRTLTQTTGGASKKELWPEHDRMGGRNMPIRANRGDSSLRKNYSNPLLNFYKSQGATENEKYKKEAIQRRREMDLKNKEKYLKSNMTAAELKRANRPSSAPMGGRTSAHASSTRGRYNPGYWTADLPQYGTATKIMRKRPMSADRSQRMSQQSPNRDYRGDMREMYYSQGSFPGKFAAKDKAAAVRNQERKERPRSACAGGRAPVRRAGERERPRSASLTRTRTRYLRSNNAKMQSDTNNVNARRNVSARRDKHVAVDRKTGVQVGVKSAREPRPGMHMVGEEWFGSEKKPLRDCDKGVNRVKKFNDASKRPVFGVRKNRGTKTFREHYDGEYAGGEFLHDQPGGKIAVAGSAAAAAKEKRKHKPAINNKRAMEIISNWHALGGSNMADMNEYKRKSGQVVEQHAAISYDPLNDMYDAFRLLQKGDFMSGDVVSVERLRAVLCGEAEILSEEEFALFVKEADKDNTKTVNFKAFCKNVVAKRLPHLAKGSMFSDEHDIVMKVQRARLRREKGAKQRAKELKAMGGLDSDIIDVN